MSTPSDSTARDVLLADLIEVRRRARRPRVLKAPGRNADALLELYESLGGWRCHNAKAYTRERLSTIEGWWSQPSLRDFGGNPAITATHIRALMDYAIAYRRWELESWAGGAW